jgi:predicted amidohydrolase YtcJ
VSGRGLLIAGCEVDGVGGLDVRLRDGIVAEIGARLDAEDDAVLPAGGGALLPGLHDHHVHLLAWAAALHSVTCGPPAVRDRAGLEKALRGAARGTRRGAWIRGVGYHESVAGPLDRTALDGIVSDRPVRVQHRGGGLWVLNGAALRALELEASVPSGRLFRADRELAARVPQLPLDLAEVGRRLAAAGVTGVTDATPDLDDSGLELLAAALARHDLHQRVLVLGAAGPPPRRHTRLALGPRKLVLDEASADLDVDAITEIVVKEHAAERAVAIHCVTRAEVVVAVESISRAGARAGDRLEHASVLPAGLERTLQELGVTVVTQPNFIAERGATYAREVDADDLDLLYRCGSLLRAGVGVAGGTDAPFGAPDPWRAMRAAVERRTDAGDVLGAAEAVAPESAIALFLGDLAAPGGPPRRVRAGAPADLCLLREPLAGVLRTLDAELVAATIAGGRVVYGGAQSAEHSSQRASTASSPSIVTRGSVAGSRP